MLQIPCPIFRLTLPFLLLPGYKDVSAYRSNSVLVQNMSKPWKCPAAVLGRRLFQLSECWSTVESSCVAHCFDTCCLSYHSTYNLSSDNDKHYERKESERQKGIKARFCTPGHWEFTCIEKTPALLQSIGILPLASEELDFHPQTFCAMCSHLPKI